MKVNRNTIAAAAAIAGRSAGSVTSRNARHRLAPSIRAASSWPGVEVRPEAADGAHDDRVVEEDVGEQDRPDGLVEARGPASGPPGAEQRDERGADDDGRQHERDGDERAHDAPARELVAGEHVGARERDSRVSTVDSVACHTVNHDDVAQRRVGDDVAERDRGRACRRARGPRPTIATTG